MLEDLKLQMLQRRSLDIRLVMLYTVVSAMVPAINADEFLLLSAIKTYKYYSNLTSMQLFPYRQIPEFTFVITISRWNDLE